MIFTATFLTVRSTENICLGPLCDVLKPGLGNEGALFLAGSTMGKLINLALIVGGLFLLLYLLWGAFDWLTSEGDKEKVSKAQKKITNALIGMLLMVISLTIFGAVTGDILGIFRKTERGWIFTLPTLNPNTLPDTREDFPGR